MYILHLALKLSSIDDQGHTNHVTFQPSPVALTFNPRRDVVMIHTHAKDQGQSSLESKV